MATVSDDSHGGWKGPPVRESLTSRSALKRAESAQPAGWQSFDGGAPSDFDRPPAPSSPEQQRAHEHGQRERNGRNARSEARGESGRCGYASDEGADGYDYGGRAGARGSAATGRPGRYDSVRGGGAASQHSPRNTLAGLPAALPKGLQKARAAGAAAAASVRPRGQKYGAVALADDADDDEML
ncbi:hypothetical protein T492DRAFT_987639 [Pavlovales sp. CCMP2436]|nr:hypothetical protein T492DRAFT_987639 [Pavlovales sp. CCMP2436]